MKLTTQSLIVSIIVFLPWLSLLGFGLWFLWEQGWVLAWLGILAGTSFLGVLFTNYLRRRQAETFAQKTSAQPSATWLENDHQAWQEVTEIATALNPADYPLNNTLPHHLLDLGLCVIETVASHYYPHVEDPVLEVPLPYLLKTIELVNRDLRRLVVDYLPFSHVLTLNDFRKAPRLFNTAAHLHNAYRMGMLFLNPANAIVNELKQLFMGKITQYPKEELQRWFLQNFAKEVGRYAIDLYSGALTLEDTIKPRSAETPSEVEPVQESLRILVLGQVKSGKSSLINALFGELKAWTDALPLTARITPYLLEREGIQQALILDTAGYDVSPEGKKPLSPEIEKELLRCDMILMVCSAIHAARQADRQVLDELRAQFQQYPQLAMPPLLCVLSHIDQLSPVREWQPPYNIVTPQRAKEHAIRKAMETTAADLQLDLGEIVPVNLFPGELYNIEEGVIPLMLARLNDAQRSRYIRCLRQAQGLEYWQKLGEQALNTGKIILSAPAYLRDKLFS